MIMFVGTSVAFMDIGMDMFIGMFMGIFMQQGMVMLSDMVTLSAMVMLSGGPMITDTGMFSGVILPDVGLLIDIVMLSSAANATPNEMDASNNRINIELFIFHSPIVL